MLNIVCVNAGNYLGRGAEYVNNLFDMVARNLAEGYAGRFLCFTDDPSGLDPHIGFRELPNGLMGWWNKLYLFSPGLFEDGDRVLYFDLDTVITGRLDEIAAYSGEFAILKDFFRQQGWASHELPLQSAVMAWAAGTNTNLWTDYVDSGFPTIPGGDQAWIASRDPKVEFWQDLFPGLFVSYKVTGGAVPSKASVVCFHGEPRPHQVTTGWVPKVWEKGGITRADLDVICNTEREVYMANVRENCKLDLPWFDFAPKHNRQVAIVGGGPSVKNALEELRYRQSLGQEIWALNGAFAWLSENGVRPTAHFIIDARPENAAFLRPTKGVKYYIASQCHPSLFDALDGCDVMVLHLLTDGMFEFLSGFDTTKPTHLLGGGTTVGLKAMLAAFKLGFRAIHVYGMDSSYDGADHHAYPQALNDRERTLDVICGERSFKCAPWMITQATDFQTLVEQIIGVDGLVTVNGTGLIPQLARDMMLNPPVVAADVRAAEILARINGTPNPKVAELGVFAGDLSLRLLASRKDLHLVMVDKWDSSAFLDKNDHNFHARLSASQQDEYARFAAERTEEFADRRQIIRSLTVEAASAFDDGEFDGVFIDADHSYEGCRRDIEAWFRKVKPGGWLMGHDYENHSVPEGKLWGVETAVNEFAQARGYNVELGENYTWFIRIPEAA